MTLSFFDTYAQFLPKEIYQPESNIMPGSAIFHAWITQPNNQPQSSISSPVIKHDSYIRSFIR
jgi:hypothetical protein